MNSIATRLKCEHGMLAGKKYRRLRAVIRDAIEEIESVHWVWTDPHHKHWFSRQEYPHDIARREGAQIVPVASSPPLTTFEKKRDQ